MSDSFKTGTGRLSDGVAMSDIADRYRTLAARFTTVAAAVPADRWSSPSPCDEWTALDVLNHVTETEAELVTRLELGSVRAAGSPLEAWTEVNSVVQGLLEDPDSAGFAYDGYFGPTTFEQTIDQFYSFDLLVHSWDLARAAGLAEYEQLPADEVGATFAAIRHLGDNLRQPGIIGPEVAAPADADEQTRFLAYLGRKA